MGKNHIRRYLVSILLLATATAATQWVKVERINVVTLEVMRGRRIQVSQKDIYKGWLHKKHPFVALVGDLNGDGIVNFVDFAMVNK